MTSPTRHTSANPLPRRAICIAAVYAVVGGTKILPDTDLVKVRITLFCVRLLTLYRSSSCPCLKMESEYWNL